jgi:hypothetical protein
MSNSNATSQRWRSVRDLSPSLNPQNMRERKEKDSAKAMLFPIYLVYQEMLRAPILLILKINVTASFNQLLRD